MGKFEHREKLERELKWKKILYKEKCKKKQKISSRLLRELIDLDPWHKNEKIKTQEETEELLKLKDKI